jgi:hypothetical protein
MLETPQNIVDVRVARETDMEPVLGLNFIPSKPQAHSCNFTIEEFGV